MTTISPVAATCAMTACACMGPLGNCPCVRRQRGEKVEITETFISKELFALLPVADQLAINALKRKALGLSLCTQRTSAPSPMGFSCD